MSQYVQYGCGLSCPDGWVNYDVSPRLRVEQLPILGILLRRTGHSLFPKRALYGDIIAGLPLKNDSARGVYCSHVIEHLDRELVPIALRNTYDLLEPGGIFRLVVPDLLWRARRFVAESETNQSDAADRFMRTSYLGEEGSLQSYFKRLRVAFGNSKHRWMYDYGLMKSLLVDAGFVAVRRCHFGDAEDRMFDLVEDLGRFIDGGNEELAIEARKLPS